MLLYSDQKSFYLYIFSREKIQREKMKRKIKGNQNKALVIFSGK